MTWTLPRILRATGGNLVQWGAGPFEGVATDSRQALERKVFVALTGENHDGHDFLAGAAAGGATAVIVSRDAEPSSSAVAQVRVPDTLAALGDLAADRRLAQTSRVVAVTGSNGKTTTKEMIASVLAAAGGKVARTRGTENNLVGLPLTLLGLDGDERFTVLEMGMNHPGEIWRLTEIARPDVGVITNVGPAHLEGLGTIENVAAAKGELALALSPTSCLVVNAEDDRLRPIARRFLGRTILVGLAGGDGPVRLLGSEPLPGEGQRVSIGIDGQTIAPVLRTIGAHNATNAVLAAAAGFALGVSAEAIARGLEAFEPPPMRLRLVVLPNGARLLNDAYNANPASMAAALRTLAAEPALRRIAVLGEMRELGPESAEHHRAVGAAAANARVDSLFAAGPFAAEMVRGARDAGLAAAAAFDTADDAGRALRDELREGDLVLLKGSRHAKMEDVLSRLESRA